MVSAYAALGCSRVPTSARAGGPVLCWPFHSGMMGLWRRGERSVPVRRGPWFGVRGANLFLCLLLERTWIRCWRRTTVLACWLMRCFRRSWLVGALRVFPGPNCPTALVSLLPPCSVVLEALMARKPVRRSRPKWHEGMMTCRSCWGMGLNVRETRWICRTCGDRRYARKAREGAA